VELDNRGISLHHKLGSEWCIKPENSLYRKKVLETYVSNETTVNNKWISRRAIPQSDAWFETAWAFYRDGSIYK
jgi:hypothetical protein